jgi:putative restriction endonuclease
VAKIRPWSRNSQQAPHKPLLLLYALRRVQTGAPRLIDFNEAEKPLRDLIECFANGTGRAHPEYPFWRLQRDGLWEVEDAQTFPSRQSNTDPPLSVLRSRHARGGLPRQLDSVLREEPQEIVKLARTVAARFFPGRVGEMLSAVGFSDVSE